MRMRRSVLSFIIAAVAITVTGCVDVGQFNLTEEEEEQVVNYCADLLLKYDKNHSSRVVDTSMARELDARVEVIKEMNKQNALQEDTVSKNKKGEGSKDGEDQPRDLYAPTGEGSVDEALSLDGFSIDYKGVEVMSSYQQEGSDGYFTLDASPGKQLMVFKFNISNETGEDRECDVFSTGASFGIVFDGSTVRDSLMTMLQNDLSTFDEVIPSGDSVETVVVLETVEGFGQGTSDYRLLVKSGLGESVISL